MNKHTHANFSVGNGRGFQMKLPNGYIVSIQIGPVNFCDNRDILNFTMRAKENECGMVTCRNAETAVFHSVTGAWAMPPWYPDQVQGDQSPADVVRLIAWAASLPAPAVHATETEAE